MSPSTGVLTGAGRGVAIGHVLTLNGRVVAMRGLSQIATVRSQSDAAHCPPDAQDSRFKEVL